MDERKIIAVSGTPGTGKSTFSKILAEDIGCELIDLNQVIDDEGIYEKDEEGTRIVDEKDLQDVFERRFSNQKNTIIVDGLLSYLLAPEQVTHIIVLRTHPDILRERLEERNYSKSKIEDNIESEALGVVVGEAVQKHGVENIYEIDTTDTDPADAVDMFKEAINGKESLTPGSVDWLEDYFEKM